MVVVVGICRLVQLCAMDFARVVIAVEGFCRDSEFGEVQSYHTCTCST